MQQIRSLIKDKKTSQSESLLICNNGLVHLVGALAHPCYEVRRLLNLAQSWNPHEPDLDEVTGQQIAPVKPWRAEDRLTRVELLRLLTAYQEGTPISVLAKQYELSMTTVKRLLRKYEIRRGSC